MTKSRARRRRAPGLVDWPRVWLKQHLHSLVASLGQLLRAPLPSLLTVAVIGIALAMPAALHVLTANLRTLASGWDQTAAFSLFLRHEVEDPAAQRLADRLREWPELARVQVIGRDAALTEFRELGGFEMALAQFAANPLPTVLALHPYPQHATPARLADLERRIQALPEADFARVDTLWLERLQAILALARRAVLVLAGLLGSGVLFIVGNTIRLEILNRRDEIEIMELVGATPAFVRRPFLYAGFWHGALGGLTAWLAVNLGVLLLHGPAARLASLYQGEFPLSGLGFGDFVLILTFSILLGLVGSWIAVNRHLRDVAPD